MFQDLLLNNERVLSKTINDSVIFTNRRIMINPNSSKKRSILIEAINRLEVIEKRAPLLPLVAASAVIGMYFAFQDNFMYAGLCAVMSLVFFLIQRFNSKKVLVVSVKKAKDLTLDASTLKTDVKELLSQIETARFEQYNQRHKHDNSSGKTKLVKISA